MISFTANDQRTTRKSQTLAGGRSEFFKKPGCMAVIGTWTMSFGVLYFIMMIVFRKAPAKVGLLDKTETDVESSDLVDLSVKIT